MQISLTLHRFVKTSKTTTHKTMFKFYFLLCHKEKNNQCIYLNQCHINRDFTSNQFLGKQRTEEKKYLVLKLSNTEHSPTAKIKILNFKGGGLKVSFENHQFQINIEGNWEASKTANIK